MSAQLTPPSGGGSVTPGDFARIAYGGGNIATVSDTFVDVHASFELTLDTAGDTRVEFGFVGSIEANGSTSFVGLDVEVDGVRQGNDFGILQVKCAATTARVNCSFSDFSDILAAGAHTFQLVWRRTGGANTFTMLADDADQRAIFWAREIAA